MSEYAGNWEGTLPNVDAFNFSITVKDLSSNSYNITITNTKTLINKKLKSISNNHIQISIDDYIHFNLHFKNDKNELTGFVNAGRLMYHVNLRKNEVNTYTGTWNPFMINGSLKSDSIFLSIDKNEDGTLAAYPFLGDHRFSGAWADNFVEQDNILSFRCLKTGFKFRSILLKDEIQLEILLGDIFLTKTHLNRFETDWKQEVTGIEENQNTNKPQQLNDGWITASINDFNINQAKLDQLIEKVISTKEYENTHSILIAKRNKLVFEAYFDGYNHNIPHDMRSASKSISSAIIGIAIDNKIIENVDKKLYEFVPKAYQYTKNPLKYKITIKDLLTMSSGLDVNKMAEEDNYQGSENWLKTVLEASMVKTPGTYADYGSANPFLLGVILNESLDKPLELYMDEKLFAPLGIRNYINQTEGTETIPYFGGGMHLTSRDMLKFGQLYLNKGIWKEKQIISENWVEESFKKHTRLQDQKDKNEYGYQWWHYTYTIDGKAINSIEARGAGGQYIFVIPELESVIVITSGNYRNGKTRQPEKIIEEYILPAMIN
ncbi:serine hydrolase [Winogradskyella sp.]|uniref:serine hydrolase domain-containing protein n=1 Tax=Winogradskyella sp. TaxID=1883156 RepID=UPI0025F16DB6|nr:serine hydrolase [Winogradskyella sp.]